MSDPEPLDLVDENGEPLMGEVTEEAVVYYEPVLILIDQSTGKTRVYPADA